MPSPADRSQSSATDTWLSAAPSTPIRFHGTLYGESADALRLLVSPGDSPQDAIRRALALCLHQQKENELLVDRQIKMDSDVTNLVRALLTLAEAYKKLPSLFNRLVAQNSGICDSAASIARDVREDRQAVVDAVSFMGERHLAITAEVDNMARLVRNLDVIAEASNAILDALRDEGGF